MRVFYDHSSFVARCYVIVTLRRSILLEIRLFSLSIFPHFEITHCLRIIGNRQDIRLLRNVTHHLSWFQDRY